MCISQHNLPSGNVERRPSQKSASTLPRDVSDENYDELSHALSFLDPSGLAESQYARIDKVRKGTDTIGLKK